MHTNKLIAFAVCSLGLAFHVSKSKADIPCGEEPYRVSYEADTLPEDDPIAPWDKIVEGEATASVEGGVLTVDATAEGAKVMYTREENTILEATSYSMETRMWITHLVIPPPPSSVSIKIRDGIKEPTLQFVFDGLNYRLSVPLASGGSLIWDWYWNEPHVYKIEVTRDQNMLVYADGQIIFDVPYNDLIDVDPGNTGFGIENFTTIESTAHYDYVRYAICGPRPDRPPIEEQVEVIREEVENIQLTQQENRWVNNQLDNVLSTDDNVEKGSILYRIGRHVSMARFSRFPERETVPLDSYLDFARTTVAPSIPGICREDGYRGKVSIISVEPIQTEVAPGFQEAHFRLMVELKPSRAHLPNSGVWRDGLVCHVVAIDKSTGIRKNLSSTVTHLPIGLTPDEMHIETIELKWNGMDVHGNPVDAIPHFVDFVVEYVNFDEFFETVVGFVDQAAYSREVSVKQSALTAQGECVDSGEFVFLNTNVQKKYRINAHSFERFTGITPDEAAVAVQIGAEAWNEQANAGHYIMGSSLPEVVTDIPRDKVWCDYWGVDFSVVVAHQNHTRSYAETQPRCSGEQFIMYIFPFEIDGGLRPWSVGRPYQGSIDLASVVAHEFGHPLALGHPANEEYATMRSDPGEKNTHRLRDLYLWDIACSHEISGNRELTAYYKYHDENGLFTPEFSSAFSDDVFKCSAVGTDYRYYHDIGLACLFTDGGSWKHNPGVNEEKLDLAVGTSIGPVAAPWREEERVDRFLYSNYWTTPDPYDWASKHYVSYLKSTDGFISQSFHNLHHCKSQMDFSCDQIEPVYSGKRIAVSWDPIQQLTVFAWVNQHRLSNDRNGVLNISAGYVNDWTISEPDIVTKQTPRGRRNVHSTVGPAVACSSEYMPDWNNCIVVYVDREDRLNRIMVQSFVILEGPNKHSVVFLSEPHEVGYNTRTASSIAAWHHAGKFWIAHRSLSNEIGQRIIVQYSTDGINWEWDSRFGDHYSVTGPSAISQFPESRTNILVYSR